jgi:perosamine synthetase
LRIVSKLISLSIPNLSGNEQLYVADALRSGWISASGEYVKRFEQFLAEYTGSRYAVATSSGTSALHLALLVAGLKPGEEVLVPTLTFIAPVNAIHYCGAVPVFMDCDQYYNLDLRKAASFLRTECEFIDGAVVNKQSGRTVWGILPVHIFGNPVELSELLEIASYYRLHVIEDASQSLGSFCFGKHTGTWGEVGCISFNGNKIATCGGGGILLTNRDDHASRARYLSTQAKDDDLRFVHNHVGYNYRLTNVQAAVGLAQTEQLQKFLEKKIEHYDLYLEGIRSIAGLSLADVPTYGVSNHWFYALQIEEESYGCSALSLMDYLRKHNVETRPVWLLNHQQKPYEACQAYSIDNAIILHKKTLNLPCSTSLTRQEVEHVIELLRKRKN